MKEKNNKITYIVNESYGIPDKIKREEIVTKKLASMIVLDQIVKGTTHE